MMVLGGGRFLMGEVPLLRSLDLLAGMSNSRVVSNDSTRITVTPRP